MVSWWRRRRRRRILRQPFPEDWENILRSNVRQFAGLPKAGQQKLRKCVRILAAEKYWEGCSGLEMTDEIRITIAGQAALLLLGWEDRYFDRLQSVLVYPTTYLAPERTVLPGGVVLESMGPRLGEAWYGGPVILSWENVNRASHPGAPGRNVVLHEFAHVLDQSDEYFDGTPLLATAEEYRQWKEVMSRELERLQRAAEAGKPTLLDEYGAVDPSEFFAVVTEAFFEMPLLLQQRHPPLYEVLQTYFRQNPVEWSIF